MNHKASFRGPLFVIVEEMDSEVLQFINQFAGRWEFVDRIAVFLAQYSGYVLIGVLVVFILATKNLWLKVSLWALFTGLIARLVITEIIRFFYDRPRPFEVLDVTQLISHGPEASLPSGHAAFYFALSLFVFFINKKIGALFLSVTILMGLGRIFAGIHYPLDILAGFGVGLVSAATVYYIYKKYFSKR